MFMADYITHVPRDHGAASGFKVRCMNVFFSVSPYLEGSTYQNFSYLFLSAMNFNILPSAYFILSIPKNLTNFIKNAADVFI